MTTLRKTVILSGGGAAVVGRKPSEASRILSHMTIHEVFRAGTGGIAVNNVMEYRGYVGSVEFSEPDELLCGRVQGIRALISYEGSTVKELIEDFHGAVDDYLSLCEDEGIAPEKAYKGSFNVRISPELHKRAAICASMQNISLNKVVENALQQYVPTHS